jgi:glycosyltransferase involved in cell wall biosynthesis
MIDHLTKAGTETQLLALIRHLDRSRVLPFLCLLKGEEEYSRALEPTDCPVIRLGVRSLHHPRTLFKAFRLARFFRRHRIDVLQVYFPDSTYLGVPVARLAGVRHVVRTRNNLGYWITPIHRWLGWFYNQLTDVMLANCDACRQAVIADQGTRPGQILVLENGVDVARFAGSRSGTSGRGPGSAVRVGVVANLRPVKNLGLFVRAAADVVAAHPRTSFHIAGEGESRPELERLIDELGLGDRFTLPGSVSDIPAFLSRLDVAVLCSHSEGMSNAVLEYMAAGKPIVATAVGANVQLIEDGVHGLLVPPGDQARLAAAVSRLLDDPPLAARLGANARRRVQERYSREAMVRRFEAFYHDLMAGNKLLR